MIRCGAKGGGLLGDFTLKLNNEAAARQAADAGLLSNINGVSAALTQEIDALKLSLGSEVTRATAAETALKNDLNAEVARANVSEGTLTTNLANEINRATSAEGTLQNNINSESAARATGDASTLAAAKAYADSLPGTGPAGPPGPSDWFITRFGGDLPSSWGTLTDFGTLTLPSGNYIVT